MWFTASVHAYDVMDSVQITASVTALGTEGEQGFHLVLSANTLLDGVGEADPRQWLEDALVGLLETL